MDKRGLCHRLATDIRRDMKILFSLILSLFLAGNAFATPNTSMSITPAAVDAETITASDENTRNNVISSIYNAHGHTDISQTANTLNVGDALAGNKTLTAYNADANKPFIRYNDTDNRWILSTDGVASSVILSGIGVIFEGATDNSFQTEIQITDPTADRFITLPNADMNFVTGLPVANGGTGKTSWTQYLVPYADTTTSLSQIAIGTSGQVLTSGGAGVAPSFTTFAYDMAYANTRFKIGSFTRDMTAVSGDVAYTGIGFSPKAIIFFANVENTEKTSFIGIGNVANQFVLNRQNGLTTVHDINTASVIFLVENAATVIWQIALIKTLDADGFTLTWTKQGSPSAGTADIAYIAFR